MVHETAVVDEGAVIGEGARVWHFVHVCGGAHVGARAVLGQNVFVAPGVHVGAGTKVQNNVSIYAGVHVAEDAFLGPSCVFTNVNRPRAFIERKDEFLPTHVGRGASVGANATIVCGHSLGDYSFVGAGAVVLRDVPNHAIVVGSPARIVGYACECGERIPEDGVCRRCGKRYDVNVEAERCVRIDEEKNDG
ncbi:MAG: acyltransferase [Myxococcota bacterium]